LREWIGKA